MGSWDGHIRTAEFKIDNHQGPPEQHRKLCPVLYGSLDGRGVGGEWMHVYLWLSPPSVHLKLPEPRKTELPAGHRELEAMLGPDAIFTAAFWTWELIPTEKNPVLILVCFHRA